MALMTAKEYIDSLRRLNTRVYMFGEKLDNWVDHPMIRPSINCVAMTYALAQDPQYADLMTATSSLTGRKINRFTHLHQSADDLVKKVKMQRLLGQKTASCFQRCVGMDAFNAVYSSTYEIDEKYGTSYHENFKKFLIYVQDNDLTVDGAMTDPKGDRSKAPHEQADPDMYVHVVERRPDGIVVCGAKCHQTGSINSHWHIFMPTIAMGEADKDYAVSFACPTDAEGLYMIYGRQSCDTRKLEDGCIDVGNAKFGGQEALVVLDHVFIPNEYIFLNGEYEFAGMIVERFAGYHRQSYGGCKVGVGDVVIGAAALAAEYNGVEKASAVKDKLIEMTHLNETLYSCGIAAPARAAPPERATIRSTCCWPTSASRMSPASPMRSCVLPRTSPAACWSPCPARRTSSPTPWWATTARPSVISATSISPPGRASAPRTARRSCGSWKICVLAPPPWVTAPSPCTAPVPRRHSAS